MSTSGRLKSSFSCLTTRRSSGPYDTLNRQRPISTVLGHKGTDRVTAFPRVCCVFPTNIFPLKLARSRHSEIKHRLPPKSTTSPQTRKRKATETLEDSHSTKKPTKAGRGAANTSSTSALNTPPPTTMDSDDEFMSGLSSQDEDFGGAQDSDDGSLGDGTCSLNP